jgi:hypothetical protein
MRNQYWYNVIFSDDRFFRRRRHFFFWLAVFIYQLLRIGIMLPISGWQSFFSLMEMSIFWGLMINMIFTYFISYALIPKYFNKKKYFLFAMGSLLVFVVINIIGNVHSYLLSEQPVFRAIGYSDIRFDYSTFIRLFGNPPLICGLFLSLKILKNWYLEQSKTETLAKENASAELQLLKAQVHPHFLFNTLNNIYSFSLYHSPQAGTLVKKLSGMLGYMINECNEKLVPLEKEIILIQDYMGLEKVRYGTRLTMKVEIHGDFEKKFIAPLLMIPFLENSFKHGTSQILRHSQIKLEITTINNQLFFKLSNSKPSMTGSNNMNKGIGLLNVKKRLQLLYPGKHQLDIQSTDENFIINMQLLLEENVLAGKEIINEEKHLVYA